MKIIAFFSILMLFLLSISACHKTEIAKDTPVCIRKKIHGMKMGAKGSIYRYDYKGKYVYNIWYECENCADWSGELIDEECNMICMTGGITGYGDEKCKEISQELNNPTLIFDNTH